MVANSTKLISSWTNNPKSVLSLEMEIEVLRLVNLLNRAKFQLLFLKSVLLMLTRAPSQHWHNR